MLRWLTAHARRLDEWLQERLGRPYNVVLSVGIIGEIVRRVGELPKHAVELKHIVPIVLLTAIDCALLVHQIGELNHRIEHRDRLNKAAAEAGGSSGLPRRRRRA